MKLDMDGRIGKGSLRITDFMLSVLGIPVYTVSSLFRLANHFVCLYLLATSRMASFLLISLRNQYPKALPELIQTG